MVTIHYYWNTPLRCLILPRHFIKVPFPTTTVISWNGVLENTMSPPCDISTTGLGPLEIWTLGIHHLAFPNTAQGPSISCLPLSLCPLSPAGQIVPQYGARARGITWISSIPDIHPWKRDPRASDEHPGLRPPAQLFWPPATLPAQGGESDPGRVSKESCLPWVSAPPSAERVGGCSADRY